MKEEEKKDEKNEGLEIDIGEKMENLDKKEKDDTTNNTIEDLKNNLAEGETNKVPVAAN